MTKTRVNWTIEKAAWNKLNSFVKLKRKKGKNASCSQEVEKLILKAFSNPLEIARDEARDLNKKFQAKMAEIKELEELAREVERK